MPGHKLRGRRQIVFVWGRFNAESMLFALQMAKAAKVAKDGTCLGWGGFSFVSVTCDMCYWLAALASIGTARTVNTLCRWFGLLKTLYMTLCIICSDQSSSKCHLRDITELAAGLFVVRNFSEDHVGNTVGPNVLQCLAPWYFVNLREMRPSGKKNRRSTRHNYSMANDSWKFPAVGSVCDSTLL